MKAQYVLTPWESKRLIARGIAGMKSVRSALINGTISIARGTSGAYVLEELLGKEVDKSRYVTGAITADGLCIADLDNANPEVAIIKGEMTTVPTFEVIETMGVGDVFIKSANAVDPYNDAGVLLGGFSGGTIAKSIGHIYARGIELVVPVGLEKLIPVRVSEASRAAGFKTVDYSTGMPVGLYPVTGTVVTEVHAIKALADVHVIPISAGGVAGGEGAIVLQVSGEDAEVGKITTLIRDIKGERPLDLKIQSCKTCEWKSCSWKGKERKY